MTWLSSHAAVMCRITYNLHRVTWNFPKSSLKLPLASSLIKYHKELAMPLLPWANWYCFCEYSFQVPAKFFTFWRALHCPADNGENIDGLPTEGIEIACFHLVWHLQKNWNGVVYRFLLTDHVKWESESE